MEQTKLSFNRYLLSTCLRYQGTGLVEVVMETEETITAQKFSRAFEKMCNFIAVAKTADPRATVGGLVMLCLLEFPDEHFESGNEFKIAIEDLFGLSIPEAQVEDALLDLSNDSLVTKPANTNYRLSPSAMATLKTSIDDAHALEEQVKQAWIKELESTYPNIPADEAWRVLQNYLCKTFRRHGLQAAALLDTSVRTPVEHEQSLSSILAEAIEEHGFLDQKLRDNMSAAISGFMAVLGTDPDRARYIAQLADGAFSFYTLEVPPELSEQLRSQLHELTLFLDTNFLFGILNLHDNTQVQLSHDLIGAINRHNLPFKMRYHAATQREMTHTIGYYRSLLRSRSWSRSLSRAAAASKNLSGIERKFHEMNARSLVDADEFIRPYEHFDHLLAEKNIKIFRPNHERADAQNDLFHEYKDFLKKHDRGDKPYETIMHDAKLLEEARHLRTNAPSSLQA